MSLMLTGIGKGLSAFHLWLQLLDQEWKATNNRVCGRGSDHSLEPFAHLHIPSPKHVFVSCLAKLPQAFQARGSPF